MPQWPDAEIPSPELVGAWITLGTLWTDRVPLWAAHWLASGYGGESLTELAGRSGASYEIHDLLPAALSECGVAVATPPITAQDRERASAMVAFVAVARLQTGSGAAERWVVQKVHEIAEPFFHGHVTSLPLGRLVGLDDEWASGSGWSDAELCAVVRRACREQMRAATVDRA